MKKYHYPLLLLALVMGIGVTIGTFKLRARRPEREGTVNSSISHYNEQKPVVWVFGRLVGIRQDVYSPP